MQTQTSVTNHHLHHAEPTYAVPINLPCEVDDVLPAVRVKYASYERRVGSNSRRGKGSGSRVFGAGVGVPGSVALPLPL